MKDAADLARKYGFKVQPEDLVKDLTVGQQQKIEIMKALYRKAQILILDEPTAVLTPQEIDRTGSYFKKPYSGRQKRDPDHP